MRGVIKLALHRNLPQKRYLFQFMATGLRVRKRSVVFFLAVYYASRFPTDEDLKNWSHHEDVSTVDDPVFVQSQVGDSQVPPPPVNQCVCMFGFEAEENQFVRAHSAIFVPSVDICVFRFHSFSLARVTKHW
jgi:hypothetical protein